MSAQLDRALTFGHTLEELASLDEHAKGRRVRVAPPVVFLTDEQFAAVDETMDFEFVHLACTLRLGATTGATQALAALGSIA